MTSESSSNGRYDGSVVRLTPEDKGVRKVSSVIRDDGRPINSHGGTNSYSLDQGETDRR